MIAKAYTKEAWKQAVEGLRETYKVFVPAKDGKFHNFMLFEDGVEPDFDYKKTKLSPKHLVFPQSERMLEYTLKEQDPEHGIMKESEKDYSAQAVVGIRPYDAASFPIMDVNFDTPDYKDPWWIKRYAATTFIGLCDNKLGDKHFLTDAGGGPYDEKGLDVITYDLGDTYVAKTLTEKGEAAIAKMGGTDAGDAQMKAVEELIANAKMPTKVPTDNIKNQNVLDLFEAPFWDDVAAGCINCGTCTFLCPTCWCFDIQDEVRKQQGDRLRNWDSCMFPLYTLHASGHNPRGEKVQRVRNRFMHKIKYYSDKYEQGVMCVGCGRCVEACPVNIDIRRVFELMNNYSK